MSSVAPNTGTSVPAAPISDEAGNVTQLWNAFFIALWQRTGGGTGSTFVDSQVAQGNAVGLASGAAGDITSISLPAGVWDVWGSVGFNGAVTSANAWINTSSASDPGAPNRGAYLKLAVESAAKCAPVGRTRLTLTQPSSVYLSADAISPGGVGAFGYLAAQKIA